jgi:hypothetical protein
MSRESRRCTRRASARSFERARAKELVLLMRFLKLCHSGKGLRRNSCRLTYFQAEKNPPLNNPEFIIKL